MNNSIFSKNLLAKNFGISSMNINANLSETSSEFMSLIKNNFMRGGSRCECQKCFEAFSSGNLKLALYIINEGKCCCVCKDSNGNTNLHYMVKNALKMPEFRKAIRDLINKGEISSCINIQDNDGRTPMLLAVLNGDEETATLLDEAGADKSIRDKNGNYIKDDTGMSDNLFDSINKELNEVVNTFKSDNDSDKAKNVIKIFSIKTNPDESSLGLPTDLTLSSTDRGLKQTGAFDDDYINNFIKAHSGKALQDRTMGETRWAKLRETLPGVDSEIEFVDEPEESTIKMEDLVTSEPMSLLPTQRVQAVPSRSTGLAGLAGTTGSIGSLGLSESDMSRGDTDRTEDFLLELERKYSGKEGSRQQPVQTMKPKPISAIKPMAKPVVESDKIDTEVDTEKLMEAINNISRRINQKPQETQLQGGERIMGYRKMNFDSELTGGNLSDDDSSDSSEYSSDSSRTSESDSDMSGGSVDYDGYYSDNEFKGMNNELSRMMQSQKDKLHEQVIDMIMSMLNKGELVKNSEPIEATERNAKLIKAYIYRQVAEKNPQLGGLDKILSISKMSDQQIKDYVEEMPDLDDLEKTIQKHLEDKQASRPPKKEKKEKKEKSDVDTTLDISMTETTESEPEPKKKATKAKAKTTKTKAKKTSKK